MIPGSRLRKAIEKGLKIISPQLSGGIFEDFKRRGVRIESDGACSTEQINSILQEIFGEDASKLNISRIYQELDSD